MDELYIVGAGPAGLGAAVAAAEMGVKPVVFEAHERPAVKPCSRGIPVVGDLPFTIPREAVLRRIRGAIMHVNGEYLFTLKDVFTGFIVDKAVMIDSLISSVGGEVVYGARYDPSTSSVKLPEGAYHLKSGIFAGGHPYYEGEKILAIQYLVKVREADDSDVLEIYFDTDIMGYFFVFPSWPGILEVGVGGHLGFEGLKARLDRFLKGDDRFRGRPIVRLEGARIALGGLRLGHVNRLVKVGEAAGFVMPLTGEGIRPSILSGYAAAKALIEGRDPEAAQGGLSIARAISIQRRILNYVMRLSSPERARLLRELPPEVHAEISLGTMNKARILRSLRGRPGALLTLARAILE